MLAIRLDCSSEKLVFTFVSREKLVLTLYELSISYALISRYYIVILFSREFVLLASRPLFLIAC